MFTTPPLHLPHLHHHSHLPTSSTTLTTLTTQVVINTSGPGMFPCKFLQSQSPCFEGSATFKAVLPSKKSRWPIIAVRLPRPHPICEVPRRWHEHHDGYYTTVIQPGAIRQGDLQLPDLWGEGAIACSTSSSEKWPQFLKKLSQLISE